MKKRRKQLQHVLPSDLQGTDDRFWDCNCKGHVSEYIHEKARVKKCNKCGAKNNRSQPDSLKSEVFLLWLWLRTCNVSPE